MTRVKWFLLLLVLILLLVLLLAKYILSTSPTPPPSVPTGWEHHEEMFGRFEVWLPKGWKELGTVRTMEYRLRDVVEGDETPFLFAAYIDAADSFPELIRVQDFDTAFEIYAPRIGEELAREFIRMYPIASVDESGRIVYPEPMTDIVTLEQEAAEVAVAYQSYLVNPDIDNNLVGTVACVVSKDHLYAINLDTIEEHDSADVPTYERILRTFRVLK